MIRTKLREIRERNRLSQVDMAERLHMSQSAYAKLETEQTSLKKEIIVQLIKEFGESAADLLQEDGLQISFKDNNGTLNGNINAENFYNYQKELFEKMLASKDKEIERLTAIIENFFSK